MTQLRDFLAITKTKQSDLAKRLGVSVAYMSELVNGSKSPGYELAFRIEDATGGAVSARSWLPSTEAQSDQPGTLPDHKDVA
jgi:transcriptional regulator with XRE-family HTH domain